MRMLVQIREEASYVMSIHKYASTRYKSMMNIRTDPSWATDSRSL